jgi:hypothetical protein
MAYWAALSPEPDSNLDLFGAEPAPAAAAPAPAAPPAGAQDTEASPPPAAPAAKARSRAQAVGAAYPLLGEDLAPAMPALLRMGGSSWSYPGWQGLVWDKAYSERVLAQRGLNAYAEHPLLRTVH